MERENAEEKVERFKNKIYKLKIIDIQMLVLDI
jgi:hypothetical protein